MMHERLRLEKIISRIESQRDVLGNETVDETITALRKQLEALEPKSPEEQRRPVTVLFADLVGFTAMSEKLDPEQVQEIQDRYFTAVTKPINSYGGSIEKYIGDAILAVFGIPRAHEDDAERAVLAGLAMQEAIQELNDRLGRSRGLQLSMRVGVHSGLVVSRVMDETDFVITGDTVNLASRIQGAAEPGTVLISEQTYNLSAALFETKPSKLIEVKGKAKPIAVYQVANVRGKTKRYRGLSGLESPLVGRRDEQDALSTVVDQLFAGRGGIVAIVGDAGIGKSRFIAEFQKSIPPTELCWIEGRSLSYSGSTAFSFWLDILRDILEVSEDAGTEELQEKLWQRIKSLSPHQFEQIYPYIAHLLALPMEEAFLARVVNLKSEELKDAIFEAIEILLLSLAKRQPLILYCEDLHWSDPTSLELLEQISNLTSKTRLLVICALRKDPEHASWRFKEKIARQFKERFTGLSLRPLTSEVTEELMGNLLAGNLPQRLKARILARVEGNPFYVEEILRSLIDSSMIERDPVTGDWLIKGKISEVPIPNTLQGVILSRMDHLSVDARQVLQTAAVIGRKFSFHLLEQISPFQAGTLNEILTVLESRQYLRLSDREVSRGITFKHVLTHEVAYQTLLKRHRRDLHKKTGEAIEQLHSDTLTDYFELLAFHFLQAEIWQKAWTYHLHSANKAKGRFANQEAITFLKRALDIAGHLSSLDPIETAEIHVLIGEVSSSINQYDRALEEFKIGLQIASEEPSSELKKLTLARISRKIGQVFRSKGEYRKSTEVIQKGIDYLDGGQPKELGALQIVMAGTLTRLGELENARYWAERGIEAVEASGDHKLLAQGYHVLGTIRRDMGNTAESLSYRQKSLEISQRLDHIPLQMEAHNNLAVAYYDLGQLNKAITHYKESRDLSERIGNLNTVARGEINLGEVYLIQGDWGAAESAFRRSLAIWERKGYLLGQAYGSSNMGAVLCRRGITNEALDYLLRAEEIFSAIRARSFLPAVYRRLASVHLAQGNLELARESCLSSLELARELSLAHEEGASLRELGRIHRQEGDCQLAKSYLEKSRTIFENAGIPYEEARSLLELAKTCLQLGNVDQHLIKNALDAAIDKFTFMGAKYDLAQAQLLISKLASGQ